MADHMHGILVLHDVADRAPFQPKDGVHPGSLGAVVQQFKSLSTIRVHRAETPVDGSLWQRNYYERILRDHAALHATRRYIESNPHRWAK